MAMSKNLIWRCFLHAAERCAAAFLVMAVLLAAGCGDTDPAQFDLNMLRVAKNGLDARRQQQLANLLHALYGTPDDPFVFDTTGLDLAKLKRAAGPVARDESGRETGLYRRHCVHCHGITGNGMGPTARFLNPYPRDYRQGVFKFKSTDGPSRPTRDDLVRILHEGIPGTAMPSFRLLTASEIDDLAEYVIYLSMRGETEIMLIQELADLSEDEEYVPTREELVETLVADVASKWTEAEENVIQPDQDAAPPPHRTFTERWASAQKGKELFLGERAGCVKCHGTTALGDGQTNDYDLWNKTAKEFLDNLNPPERPKRDDFGDDAEAYDEALAQYREDVDYYHFKQEVAESLLPVRNLRPRNLREGVYRGGRRPLDIYRRIHAGINGALMPGGAKTPQKPVGLSSEEIWHLVDYVRMLPFDAASLPPGAHEGMMATQGQRVTR